MIYDFAGRPLPEAAGAEAKREIGRRAIVLEAADREEFDAGRGLTPMKLDAIFRQANAGDPAAQARLAEEIGEKDWDAAQALQTRTLGLTGLSWAVEARSEDARATRIAEAAEDMLREIGEDGGGGDGDVIGFPGAVEELTGGLLPGYSLLEILWGPGGKTITGFVAVPRRQIAFGNSREPLIVSKGTPAGAPLLPNKFVWHRHHARSGDATRGGLIRPLGWMHLFMATGMKDLMRFAEKFGMPFVSARVDESAWATDRTKIAALVKNFGSDGGGVFSKAVELEMLEGAQSGGDVYFRLLEYFGAAKTKVILGQTATSGDAGGFSKGQSQENVRRDLLQADCRVVAATVRARILAPWVAFNFGPEAPVPEFRFEFDDPVDLKADSEVVLNLSNAGYQVDPEEIREKFGYTVTLKSPAGLPGSLAMADGRARGRGAAGLAAAAANETLVANAARALAADGAALRDWLGPIQEAIQEALAGFPGTGDEEPDAAALAAFRGRFAALLDQIPALARAMDTRRLEEHISRAMFAADANGRLQAAGGPR